MADITYIVYENGDEVLVTTPNQEADFLNEYGESRVFDEYDRTELRGSSVRIFPRELLVSG